MGDLESTEIGNRRAYFAYNWDADNFASKPSKARFAGELRSKLELLYLARLDQDETLIEDSIKFIKKVRSNVLTHPSHLYYANAYYLLAAALFLGRDSDFQIYTDVMRTIEEEEQEHKSVKNYFYYKCLCSVWRGDTESALKILENNKKEKGKKKFWLPSAADGISALLSGDEAALLDAIDKMRDEHASKHKRNRMSDKSFVLNTADLTTLALVKVAEKRFPNIASKLAERIDTFKFISCYIEGLDQSVRGTWSIDYMFPMSYWQTHKDK